MACLPDLPTPAVHLVHTGPVSPPAAVARLDAQRHALDRRWTVGLLALIVGLDAVLLGMPDHSVLLTTWWSSVGLGVVLLAVAPLRRWPALLVVLALLSGGVLLGFDVPPRVSLTLALSHAAQALAGASILTRAGRRRAGLASLPDLGLLSLAAVASAVLGVGLELSVRPDDVRTTAQAATQIGIQHGLSVMLFGALLLSAAEGQRARRRFDLLRVPALAWLQSATLAAVLAVIFFPEAAPPLTFIPIPLLVFGAIAFELRIATTQLAAVAAVVTIATANGRGPFSDGLVRPDLIGSVTLGYIACSALASLPLAVIVHQRRGLLQKSAADDDLFRRSFTESPLGMVMMQDDGGLLRLTQANAAAASIFELDPADLEGRSFGELVSTLDYRDVFDALISGEVDTWHGRASVLTRPGSRIDLAIAAIAGTTSSPVFSAQLLDQTQEQDSRRRLEVAHKLTDATLDTAACIILVTDESGTIVRINGATKHITGYDEHALVGTLLWDSPLAALTRSEMEAMLVWPNRSGFPMTRERLSYTADGLPIRLVWNSNIVRAEAGAPSYAVLTGVDVTAERSNTGLVAHLLQASVATALIGIDVTGRITVFNSGAAHMLGSTAEEMIGTSFISLLDPAQLLVRTGAVGEREAFLCLVGMIGHGDESAARDWTWRTRAGHELIVSMTLSVTDDNVEDRVGFLCVGRDVTEQREGQDTLVAALDKERTAVERLRSLDRAKDEFVSTVSHELRTPVTSILGYTELLLDGDVVAPDPKQVVMLETIARNSHRLIAICSDLLLLSGFEAREALANPQTYDLRDAVGAAQDFTRAITAQRPLSVTFSTPDEPVLVTGDRSQLDRVLVNLVSNAIKFTQDDGRIDVRLIRDPVLGAIITVADNGVGIHADDHDHVFQRFYRTEHAQVMAIPGTGLGLSIVAGIVEAHGGSIALDSAPHEGATFTVLLPVVD